MPLLERGEELGQAYCWNSVAGGLRGVVEQPLLGVEKVLGGVAGRAVLDQHALAVRPLCRDRMMTLCIRGHADTSGIEAVGSEAHRALGFQGQLDDMSGGDLPVTGRAKPVGP